MLSKRKILILAVVALACQFAHAAGPSNKFETNDGSESPKSCADSGTTPTASCAQTPSADFDTKGRLWVTWVFQNRLYVQSSSDGGQHLSLPLAVNREPEKILANGENRPKIKIGPEGQIYLTWSKSLDKDFSSDVRFSRSLDGGKTFSEPQTLNDNHLVIGHSFESLALDGGGKIFVAWLDARDAETAKTKREAYNGSSLYYTWSNNEGKSFESNVKAADHTCECCRIQTAIDNDGMPVITWRNIYSENIRDHAIVKLSNWSTPGKPIRVTHDDWYIEGCPHHGPGFSIASDGRYHLAWFSNTSDGPEVFYAYSDDKGAHFSKPEIAGYSQDRPSHPHVLSLGQSVYMVWLEFDGDTHLLKGKQSKDRGQNWSGAMVLAKTTSKADSPFLIHHGDNVYVSWANKAEGLKVIPLNGTDSRVKVAALG